MGVVIKTRREVGRPQVEIHRNFHLFSCVTCNTELVIRISLAVLRQLLKQKAHQKMR